MNENETEFKNAVLDEISACPLLPFFRWAPALGESQWVLYSPRWRTVEQRGFALDTTKRILRQYFFALLRKDLYTASDPASNFFPHMKVIAGIDKYEPDVVDTQPLRYNQSGELIPPTIVGSGVARINPEWMEAQYEVVLQAPEYGFDLSSIRQNSKIEVRQGNDEAGNIFVMMKIRLPGHATDGVKQLEKIRQ